MCTRFRSGQEQPEEQQQESKMTHRGRTLITSLESPGDLLHTEKGMLRDVNQGLVNPVEICTVLGFSPLNLNQVACRCV